MSGELSQVATVKIYPAIGIARVGNSPTAFFIGPEHAGETVLPPGGYKDPKGRVKRQAARFRLFGFDAQGHMVREITSKDASITWTVHLANKKAAWKRFEGPKRNTTLRNGLVKDRATLVIDPGPRTCKGTRKSASFDTGTFAGRPVPLGDMRTDEDGRLLVLGGFGHSASPGRKPITTYANNDGWFDDVSDGPVTAIVRVKGSTADLAATGAWVIVGPPDFAPFTCTTTTLYDTLQQKALNAGSLTLPEKPSFTKDIYPLLARTVALKWVSPMVGAHHDILALVTPPPGDPADRKFIFNELRRPSNGHHPSGGTGGDMPMLLSDTEEPNECVTVRQYTVMKQWSEGEFIDDWHGSPVDPEITPDGLTRAALDTCVGGPFFPGIEAGWLLRDVYACSEPFRLDHAHLEAGDVTKQMAVPWQADFYDCQADDEFGWWPSQRPDSVFPEAGGPQVSWTRGLVTSKRVMVRRWADLGFVAKRGDRFVETERKK